MYINYIELSCRLRLVDTLVWADKCDMKTTVSTKIFEGVWTHSFTHSVGGITLFLHRFQLPAMKRILDGYTNQKYNYKRQKGSRYHPARSCRDLQLDSDVTVESGEYSVLQPFLLCGETEREGGSERFAYAVSESCLVGVVPFFTP